MSVPAQTIGAVAERLEPTRLVARAAPESLAAEQYRVLLARIDRVAAARPLRAVAITSCARGEGRSLTAANLALTAAREGRDVALVECDLRRPSLVRLLELAPRAGIAEVAEGRADLSQALVRMGTLSVLCAGEPRDPATIARSPRLSAALETLRASCALTVLDVPPALALSESGRLVGAADGIVLVVRAGTTPRDVVLMAVETLAERLIGIVLNGVDEPGYARYLSAAEPQIEP